MKTLFSSIVVAAVILGSAMCSTSDAHWRGRYWGYGAYYRPYAYPSYSYSYGYYPSYASRYGHYPSYGYGYSPYASGNYYGSYSPYSCAYGYGHYGW